jgi:hypothetical protein
MAMPEIGPLTEYPGLGVRQREPQHLSARRAMRVGDVDRDAAAQELGDHFAAGRLTLEELHERLGLVLSARTTGQLSGVMADLPAPREPAFREAPPALAAGADQERKPAGDDTYSGGAHPDSAGRVAAVALLLIAMLIWLFTALLFAGHGYGYYHHPPYPPPWQQ